MVFSPVLRSENSLLSALTAAKRRFMRMLAVSAPADSRDAGVSETAARLLNDYGNSVFRLAYTYLHNREDAEEVVQDTLVQYLQTAPVRPDL